MVKLTFCLRRLPWLSREEFHRYWREIHAPLVRQHAAALRLQRYVQVYTLTVAANQSIQRSRNTGEPYDGVAELWWGTLEDVAAAINTPEGRQADLELREDERRFIDLAQSSAWFAEEYTIFSGP